MGTIFKETTNSGKRAEPLKNHVSVFARTAQKSEAWIADMHAELKWMDADSVYHLLRSVLHSLRDQLSINEVAQLASQMPLLLRGTFYENWNPKLKVSGLSKDEFLEDVQKKLGPIGQLKFDLEAGVGVALKVIYENISPGEMKDIMAALKPSLKDFIDAKVRGSRKFKM